jgi:Fe-S-cluster-containing dehydrogenase component
MHCGQPGCEAVCPQGAITKRSEDGIVVVDRSECIGCESCAEACPFGAPQHGKDGKMQKCDLCVERFAQGKQPVCVETCPGEALQFGTMEQLSELAAPKEVQKLAGPTQPSVLISSSVWAKLQSNVAWK